MPSKVSDALSRALNLKWLSTRFFPSELSMCPLSTQPRAITTILSVHAKISLCLDFPLQILTLLDRLLSMRSLPFQKTIHNHVFLLLSIVSRQVLLLSTVLSLARRSVQMP